MEESLYGRVAAESANDGFNFGVLTFLNEWVKSHGEHLLLRFEQRLEEYLLGDALRDFFLTTKHPLKELLKDEAISAHLGRGIEHVYFDPITGDPLFSCFEQRIYNLARRMDSERMHIPFRSVHPLKQDNSGDVAAVSSYPENCEQVRYNSGNHFCSRPANLNVFEQNSEHCKSMSTRNLHIFFKRGFLGDRLEELKVMMTDLHATGESELHYFIICSRHSLQEGHFGTSLVIMDPMRPDFPLRVMVCDTLLKELPQHPRWWNHFINGYAAAFGEGISEIVEDLSHPLQKVNIKGDDPFRHDWDCPYYAASMAEALANLVLVDPSFLVNGSPLAIHEAMKAIMPAYYYTDLTLKQRSDIRIANREKRWESGRLLVEELVNLSVFSTQRHKDAKD